MSEVRNLSKNINIGDSVLIELNKKVIESGFVCFLGDLPIRKIERNGHFYEYYQEALIISKDRIGLTIITLNEDKKILKSNDGNFKNHIEHYIIQNNDSFFIKKSSIFLNEICFLP